MSDYQREYWERTQLDKRRRPTHPVVQSYVEGKLKALAPHVPITNDTKVLEVGCGNGFFTHAFDRQCDVTGVDYSEKMLALNPVSNTRRMNAENLEFDDDSFDFVFCHGLLHHVGDEDKTVREMARVSRKHVVILEPNRNNPLVFLFSLVVPEERRALSYSLGYLKRLVVANGLSIVRAFSHGSFVPNKTPETLRPFLVPFDVAQPLGVINFLICEKGA